MSISKVVYALTEMAKDATFTKSALKTFEIALEDAKKLEAEVISLEGELARTKTALREVEAQFKKQGEETASWVKREDTLIAREKAISDLEKATAVSNARSDVYLNVLSMMFKNTQVRKEVIDSVYHSPNISNNNQGVTKSKTKTETETIE